MKRFVLVTAVLALVGAAPAAASPTIRLAIIHTVQGCHVWQKGTSTTLGARTSITVPRGTRLEVRISCPMDFDFTQTAGPKLALGDRRTFGGTIRTIVFRKPGLYRLVARNVQTPEEVGLQTLGPANTVALTVRVR